MDFLGDDGILLLIDAHYEEEKLKSNSRIRSRELRSSIDPFDIPDSEFQSEFRFSKKIVKELIAILEPHAPKTTRSTAISFERKFLAALQFFVCGSYQRVLGQKYNISLSQPMVSKSIHLVCDLVIKYLMPKYIRFPRTANEDSIVRTGFYEKYGVRGVLGAIDCTHVRIAKPEICSLTYPAHIYLDKCNNYSINVEVVSDSNLRILAINTRFPGSVHDSKIWQSSQVRSHMEAKYIAGDKCNLILGDSNYPQQPWIFTPILNAAEGSPDDLYNKAHQKARNSVERTIGVMKQTFRCCFNDRELYYRPTVASKIIYTIAVFHNIAVANNMDLDKEYVHQQDEYDIVQPFEHTCDNNEDLNWQRLGEEARRLYIRLNY